MLVMHGDMWMFDIRAFYEILVINVTCIVDKQCLKTTTGQLSSTQPNPTQSKNRWLNWVVISIWVIRVNSTQNFGLIQKIFSTQPV